MSLRKFPLVTGEYYHIYSRGNGKRDIFHDKADYQRFIRLLFIANSEENFRLSEIKNPFSIERGDALVSVGAYCLMPNHFHILLKQESDGGISKFIQKIMTGYTMYYNKRYEKTGSLCEGKFKSELLDTDNYLKYVFSYIHLNPVKLIFSDWKERGFNNKIERNRALVFLEEYPYSSSRSYIDPDIKEGLILTKRSFPKYFPNKKSFRREIIDWLSYKERPQGKAS